MPEPRESTRRTILGSLYVHDHLAKVSFTGGRKGRQLELYGSDQTLFDDTFDDARSWLVDRRLVTWERKPGTRYNVMRLGPAWGYAFGVVLGHQSVRCGLGDARGELLRDGEGPLLRGQAAPQLEDSSPDEVFGLVAEHVQALLERSGIEPDDVRGITVALPSPVNLAGRLASDVILRGLTGEDDLRPAVRRALEGPGLGSINVAIDNDANVAGVGEWMLRQGDELRPTTLLTVKVSGGIGGALVETGGRVLRGATGAAGELGHLLADLNVLDDPEDGLPALASDTLCRRCGGAGHLESYASAPAIADRVFGADADGDYGQRHTRLISALADSSDSDHARATAAVSDAGKLLGRALIPIVEFVDPDLIVVSGRMRLAGETLTEAIRDELHDRSHVLSDKPPVVASDRSWSGVLGAIRTTLRNEPPPMDKGLRQTVVGPLREAMRSGPESWRSAEPLLGPEH